MTQKALQAITERIVERSHPTRTRYVDAMKRMGERSPHRNVLSCGNLAHGFAACESDDKAKLAGNTPNIGIVTAYNDMLSAHQPYGPYPDKIKAIAKANGAVAQVAGGVPAMCDGVTQGQLGMELSLFSRDVIAMSTAVSLSHNMFDAALCLGICDKIVPGLLIGSLQFSYMPIAFVPAGPMPSGLPNEEKARVREQYAKGEVGKDKLLEAESQSYHSPGTCTFYGTANSNQMFLEMMGLQLPGSSFINPGTPLRDALTRRVVELVLGQVATGPQHRPMYDILNEKAIVNAIVGLHATGGSTNHAMHLVAIARAAGIIIDWTDMAELSKITPLLCRIYPNGSADVNHFHEAGGVPFVIRELLEHGVLHGDVNTILGEGGLERFTVLPRLDGEQLTFDPAPAQSRLPEVVAPASAAFRKEGGMQLVQGNLGRAIVKTSALSDEQCQIKAPARIFTSQHDLIKAFEAGELVGDMVAVVTHQGPKACGMPELHKLTPTLRVLEKTGYKVALLTDGRMSGASGKVLAAIHLTPEAATGGMIGKLRDGDMIHIDAMAGILQAEVSDDVLAERAVTPVPEDSEPLALGRELFANAREQVTGAEEGACFLTLPGW